MRKQKFPELFGQKGKKVKVVTDTGKLTAVDDSYEFLLNVYNVELDSATAAVVASDAVETKVLNFSATNSVHALVRTPDNMDPDGLVKVTFAAIPAAGTAWATDTVTALGDIVVPDSAGEDGLYFVATDIGAGDHKTHAATEPTWPTTAGDTVVDDEVTWTAIESALCKFTITSKAFVDGTTIKQTGTSKALDTINVYPADGTDEEKASLQAVYVKASDLGWDAGSYYSVEITRTAIAYAADTYDYSNAVGIAGFIFTLPVE